MVSEPVNLFIFPKFFEKVTPKSLLIASMKINPRENDPYLESWWSFISSKFSAGHFKIVHTFRENNKVADSLAYFGCDSQSDSWFSSTADLPQQIKVYFPRESGLIEYQSDWFGFVNFHFISSNVFGCLVALCEQVYVLRFSLGVRF